MKIVNTEDRSMISKEAILCRSSLSKARGLMFSRRKDLIFEFRKPSFVPLHMFFVFFAIDVLFLDDDKRIIEMKKGFRPFRYYRPKKLARYVIELSLPRSGASGYAVGDKLQF
jgi:hypothetical protein